MSLSRSLFSIAWGLRELAVHRPSSRRFWKSAGPWGGRLISLLICISALGAINGQIFTGARIYYAMGKEHRLFALLGRWHAGRDTPLWSLLIQGGDYADADVIGFGLNVGSSLTGTVSRGW